MNAVSIVYLPANIRIPPVNINPTHQRTVLKRKAFFNAILVKQGPANCFLKAFAEDLGKEMIEFSAGAMNLLVNYDWPGNVRELESAIQSAVILATDKVIRQAHLVSIIDMVPRLDLDVPRTADELKRIKKVARQKSVENIEKLFVLEALKRNSWNATKSAEETGMQRANFQALMKKYNIRIRGAEQDPGASCDS